MSSHKPIEEYELHDHGDGNGWQVVSKGPGKWGVITTADVEHHEGMIKMNLERYIHGMFSSSDHEQFILTPEEAEDLAGQLKSQAEIGWGFAMENREKKVATKS